MRLKSLELVGFKSFLESTKLNFASGVTAVVGPNGCGKSNVVDAVRWVLGEQAPTRLRGKSAEDLIFAGNDANPAAGMAEVSLVLEAAEGLPFPEPYAALSEVAVTRRVFRSGDSEYLINKIPCRLKDITEFFMALQIHSRSFALIEQGRVEEIVQSKPEHIRAMIEEAAGLSLFKGRREMSERKLERVRENLARVDDVLKEIERQLGYARRQAKKAEAYKVIRAELAELERLHAARRILDQRAELAVESEREAELGARVEALQTQSATLRAAVEQGSAAAQSADSACAAAQRELEALHAGTAERARTREFLARRLDAIEQSEPVHTARLAELEAKATLARAARAAAGAALARESTGPADGTEAELKEIKHRHSTAQAALRDTESRTEELKDDLSEIVREAAVIRGRLGDLAGERAELEEHTAAHETEAPALVAAAESAGEAMRAAEATLLGLRSEVEALQAEHREAAGREIEARAALEHLNARIEALTRAAGAERARIEADGVSGDADRRLRTVLDSLNGDRPPLEPPLLSSVLSAPAELEPALKAVLGDEFDGVIVDSAHFAVRAIEILKEKNGGRLSFIPAPADGVATAQEPIQAPGIAGRLADMVAVAPHFRPVVEMMLGHVVLADDLHAALRASNLNGHGTLFVTRDGDLVRPGRMIRGGSAAGADGATARPEEPPVYRAAEELERAEPEREQLRERLAACAAARERAVKALDATRLRVSNAEREASARRAEAAAARQKFELAEARIADARQRLVEIRELTGSSQERLRALATTEQEARARLSTMREDVAAQRAAVEQLGATMLEAASRAEARRARLRGLEQEFRHARASADDLDAQIDRSATELARAQDERSEFRAELEKIAAQDEEARQREVSLAEARTRLEAECAARGRELSERRGELARAETELGTAQSEAVECGLRCERAKTLTAELTRSFAEKFTVEFDTMAEELAGALSQRDAEADAERLATLRARAEKIGEVNLAAESEVKELEERSSKLEAERADLDAAVKDLTQTIARLSREARKRFAETFAGAARNFETVFPKLLPGGKGRLELAEADDMREAGVNILVQPAGKKVKDLAQLSGGEKALCAMALIFSLFLLNPSPFCVMDEVDAPLDEFRLNAFTALVGELKERSQFIVITHNQRTMQRADQIHGVTMERPGISRVISLRVPQAA